MTVPWAIWRELRNNDEFRNEWVVDVFPRFDSGNAETVALTTKRRALDLVDEHALRLAETR